MMKFKTVTAAELMEVTDQLRKKNKQTSTDDLVAQGQRLLARLGLNYEADNPRDVGLQLLSLSIFTGELADEIGRRLKIDIEEAVRSLKAGLH